MGKFLVSDSPTKEFTLEESSLIFSNSAQDEVMMDLTNGKVKMVENTIVGTGIIKAAVSDPQEGSTRILSNTFKMVILKFVQPKSRVIVLRNNKFENGSRFDHDAALQHCDKGTAKTGQDAGCDLRAECTEPVEGDVQCQCKPPLQFRTGVLNDGSKCELDGKILNIYHESTTIEARVRKPQDLKLLFQILAQSETTFNVTINSSAPYLVVVPTATYDMSTARPVLYKSFNLMLLGGEMKWSDSDEREAFISISAPNLHKQGRFSSQTLTVRVSLHPYGSCKHTMVEIEGIGTSLTHLTAHITLNMVAKDADGELISKTSFDADPLNSTYFRVSLIYLGEPGSKLRETTDLSVARDLLNRSKYSAAVPTRILMQPGMYELVLEMENAWDERKQIVTSCVPEQMPQTTFKIFAPPDSKHEIIVGGIVGALLVFASLALGHYVQKNRIRAREMLMSIVENEVTPACSIPTLLSIQPTAKQVVLVVGALTELWDVSGDSERPLSHQIYCSEFQQRH